MIDRYGVSAKQINMIAQGFAENTPIDQFPVSVIRSLRFGIYLEFGI